MTCENQASSLVVICCKNPPFRQSNLLESLFTYDRVFLPNRFCCITLLVCLTACVIEIEMISILLLGPVVVWDIC